MAFDTNALIDLLTQAEPHASLVAAVLERVAQGSMVGVVSTIVQAELLVKPIREGDAQVIANVEALLSQVPGLLVCPADSGVARQAARIRATTQLTLADAIIAATAVEQRCEAIIGNDREMATRFLEVSYILLGDYA